jgi:glycoside/pentoside/hexuronide:cation symporter, GPH family
MQDRIPFHMKLMYGAGAFVNNLLAAAIGGMVIILNLGLGMNPALVGTLAALPRLTDALTDPIMGYLSDNTRSRWGRRRPYIFAGAILAGLLFYLLWQLPEGRSESFYFWVFLTGSIFFYMAYTMFATPWVALGYELTPDYHERTRLMGMQNFIGQLAYVVSPWFLWIMSNPAWFDTQLEGARGLAGGIGVVVVALGILPAIFLTERFVEAPGRAVAASKQWVASAGSRFRSAVADFFRGMKLTIQSRPFVRLCIATFLVFNGFILISSFSVYVIIYYVFGGDQTLGAEYAGYAGTVGAISTFVVIVLATWLGTHFGKRMAFFITTGISVAGYLLKWFCYNPDHPWLVVVPAPLMAFGLGGLFTLVPAMMADVVDQDELQSYARREGMFGSIFWWVVKLGMAAALMGGGFLLNATGFDVALEGVQSENTILALRLLDALVPALCSLIAIWVVARYPITESVAAEVRAKLEARRGAPAGAT